MGNFTDACDFFSDVASMSARPQSTPKKNPCRKTRVYRFECCVGRMAFADLHDIEEQLDKMSEKEKKKLLVDLIQKNSSCSGQTISLKGVTLCKPCCLNLFGITKVEWEKLQRRQPFGIPKTPRRRPKQEFAQAWLRRFLQDHGQHSPTPTKKTFVQGFTKIQIHREFLKEFTAKGYCKESLLQFSRFTTLIRKMKVSLGKVRNKSVIFSNPISISKCIDIYIVSN
jgi:hypothetical protein